jgi:hypothetical protein
MALTQYQRSVCKLIAKQRADAGERYVAGGAALNELIAAPRVSRDVDLFHDTATAVDTAFEVDSALLTDSGLSVVVSRRRPGFVEAEVTRDGEAVILQWVQDSAYRYFPLVEHEEFGLTLHPVDLATNKVLALVGRLEVRDWVDVIETSERLQPLGCLAWAASGKDPGFSPLSIIEHAARSSRYSAVEVSSLSFEGPPPSAAHLSQRWHEILERAREIVGLLPADQVGKCVLDSHGSLLCGTPQEIRDALAQDRVRFHSGSIRGALPTLVG